MNDSRAQLQKTQLIGKFTAISDIGSTGAKSNQLSLDIASTEVNVDFQLNTALLQNIKYQSELLRCGTTSAQLASE